MLNDQELWHNKLGHLILKSMKLLKNSLTTGVDFADVQDVKQCSCLKGKQSRKLFSKTGATKAKELLELVHSDVCGPMPANSWSGAR